MEHTARAAPYFTSDNMDYTKRGALFLSLACQDHPRRPVSSWTDFLDRTGVRPASALASDHVNAGTVTDFSIERILSPDVRTTVAPQHTSSSCYVAPGTLNSYLHCAFYPAYPAYPAYLAMPGVTAAQSYVYTCNADQRSAEERRRVQQLQRKPRQRTVFKDSQLQRLEEVFEHTRYPAPEMRAEVAQRTGLSEETVRVWFKNHRARRKRQTSSSQSSHGH